MADPTPTISEEWLDALVDNVVSEVQATGWVDKVNEHEPKKKPGHGITAAVWPQYLGPTKISGLANTSARVNMFVRLYMPSLTEPSDMIDRRLLKAVSSIIRRYHDDFDFGGTIRNVDLLGMEGQALEAQAGYLEIDKKLFRVMTITVPCIVNDVWPQATA